MRERALIFGEFGIVLFLLFVALLDAHGEHQRELTVRECMRSQPVTTCKTALLDRPAGCSYGGPR